jgi:diacylglycerol O-acyltransferase / wax synthase
MNQLKALDASFLYVETARMPMHIGSVQIFEVPAERRESFFADLKQLIRSRADLLPYLRHRVENAPLQIDLPHWVACEPDYDAHIERVVLPAPGDVAQLERTVAELDARPLDRTRPLWKIYYIEGLEAGRVAYFSVVHHACVDGLAAQASVHVLTDAMPEPAGVATIPSGAVTAPVPAPAPALDRWAGAERIARAARRIDTLLRLGGRLLAPPPGTAAAMIAPATPINREIGATRGYAMLRISLSDVDAIGRARGCSINDVFLTICGGALRAYLLRAQALPAASLIAGVPVSVRRPGDRTMNTQVTMTRVALATQIEDPAARLAAVHASSIDAKALAHELDTVLPSNPRFPGAPWFGRAASRMWEISGAANYLPPLVNVVISNIPGPRTIRYSNGARMLTHFPVSSPAHGIGVNITAQSYAEFFDIGITVCARTMPDVLRFRDDLLRAYIDLRAQVLNRGVETRALHPPDRGAAIERRCRVADRTGDDSVRSERAVTR